MKCLDCAETDAFKGKGDYRSFLQQKHGIHFLDTDVVHTVILREQGELFLYSTCYACTVHCIIMGIFVSCFTSSGTKLGKV